MSDTDDNAPLPNYPEFLLPYLEQIRAKIPADWVDSPARKGGGWRWSDPANLNNQVRIDPGRPEVSLSTQQRDHVVISYNGVIVGRNGQKLPDGVKSDPEIAHIPLQEWLSWQKWYIPEE